MTALALQFGLSLVGIVVLWLIARALGLGGDPRIRGEARARDLAEAAICGFAAQDVTVDRAGIGALLRDADGRILLLRRHGSRFVSRLIESHADIRLDQNFLTIGTGEARFGRVTLDLGREAQVWAARLRGLDAVP